MAVLRRSIGPLVLAVGATLLGSGAKVGAQEAANPGQPGATPVAGLEEVVVTAQRRTEDLQRAAVAVTALSGADIAERGVTQLADLTQLVPAVEIDAGAGPYSGVSLRGVATTAVNSFADPAIAVNLDGIYLPRPTSPQGLFYDLERIEVLKGPQGTLYGRNATGGAINIVTRAPRLGELSAEGTIDVGNYGQIEGTGQVNVPLGDAVALRGAFQIISRDGYFSDGTSDEQRQSGRITLLVKPDSDLTFTLHTDYTHLGGKGTGATAYCLDGLPAAAGGPS